MLPTMSTPAPARLTVEPPDFRVTALEPSRMMLDALSVILPAASIDTSPSTFALKSLSSFSWKVAPPV